jgi:hypothetical protein
LFTQPSASCQPGEEEVLQVAVIWLAMWDPSENCLIEFRSYPSRCSWKGGGREGERKEVKTHLLPNTQVWKWHTSLLPHLDARCLRNTVQL